MRLEASEKRDTVYVSLKPITALFTVLKVVSKLFRDVIFATVFKTYNILLTSR